MARASVFSSPQSGGIQNERGKIDALRPRVHPPRMSTLAEIEEAVPQLSADELAKLERFVRNARRGKARETGVSAFDLPPLDLGRMLRPLGSREEWCDEMMEGRV